MVVGLIPVRPKSLTLNGPHHYALICPQAQHTVASALFFVSLLGNSWSATESPLGYSIFMPFTSLQWRYFSLLNSSCYNAMSLLIPRVLPGSNFSFYNRPFLFIGVVLFGAMYSIPYPGSFHSYKAEPSRQMSPVNPPHFQNVL